MTCYTNYRENQSQSAMEWKLILDVMNLVVLEMMLEFLHTSITEAAQDKNVQALSWNIRYPDYDPNMEDIIIHETVPAKMWKRFVEISQTRNLKEAERRYIEYGVYKDFINAVNCDSETLHEYHPYFGILDIIDIFSIKSLHTEYPIECLNTSGRIDIYEENDDFIVCGELKAVKEPCKKHLAQVIITLCLLYKKHRKPVYMIFHNIYCPEILLFCIINNRIYKAYGRIHPKTFVWMH